ncbi:type III-B CRISPR module RAMP protein Cmr4 [Synechococcus sp. PCC 7336]|uniref:type III-B CRISPR module RAMP protein Cmr4 n=1 Tax=Synechococcus sp. PCC 7336 TaxID=195250 RepID=UPI00034AC0B7|nr:type III-B CRISPR module RAMP protein Cmr4 [Synechococcus sp. PCC 7336]
MTDFRIGYLYGLAPIHCGGEGDLGNILDIAREVHTQFPYIPGSSLRGSLRREVESLSPYADLLFGQEQKERQQMGVHQVWFGDARLLWVPMRTMALNGTREVFTWVSCHSLIRDRALVSKQACPTLPKHPIGTRAGTYHVADARIEVQTIPTEVSPALALSQEWPLSLQGEIAQTWSQNRIVLPDADFQVLMEHSLWTQVRNKIQADTEEEAGGSAEVFWTDICIPKDTLLYFPWGYSTATEKTLEAHEVLHDLLSGLLQVGGQANVGRGWVQSWVGKSEAPQVKQDDRQATPAVGG